MSKYRQTLPQFGDRPFLSDGGHETTLMFHESLALPHLAAFDLLKDDTGLALLRRYFEGYIDIARLTLLGGCCGTDHRHLGAIASCCVAESDIHAERRSA
jgi:S-methylmethionine-dependent homocysteine/selenocysteine methylase